VAGSDVRIRIIEVAGPIFAEKGYRDATVREICKQAGVGSASVNYYFRDKAQLLAEVLQYIHDTECSNLRSKDYSPDWSPEIRLWHLVRDWLVELRESDVDSWVNQLWMRLFIEPNPASDEVLVAHLRGELEPLQEVFRELLPEDTPDGRRWQITLSIVGQLIVYYDFKPEIIRRLVGDTIHAEDFGPDDLAEHVCRFTLAALGRTLPDTTPYRSGSGDRDGGDSAKTRELGSGAERTGETEH